VTTAGQCDAILQVCEKFLDFSSQKGENSCCKHAQEGETCHRDTLMSQQSFCSIVNQKMIKTSDSHPDGKEVELKPSLSFEKAAQQFPSVSQSNLAGAT
jgi:hypothetical protein